MGMNRKSKVLCSSLKVKDLDYRHQQQPLRVLNLLVGFDFVLFLFFKKACREKVLSF